MKTLRWLVPCFSALLFSVSAVAEEFEVIDRPKFEKIEARLVYGHVVYDFKFAGNDTKVRSQSATNFLKSLVSSKFQNKKGNYIVTLELTLNGQKIASEPVLVANWEESKFLFLTTSEKSNLVVNRNGVLMENVVIDKTTNKAGISLKIFHSENSAVDMSLFKEVADLAKTAALGEFSPGVLAVTKAYQPFQDILTQLLSKYTEQSIVDNSVGAFTLLDTEFGNQLQYKADRFSVNVYLQTDNSQLPTNFTPAGFTLSNFALPLSEVKSGVGAARAPVLELVESGSDHDLSEFVRAVRIGTPFGMTDSPYVNTDIRPQCAKLRNAIDSLVTSRDSALLYWAFLRSYHGELVKYRDGKMCAGEDLQHGFADVNLHLNDADWK
jgi:hypothetical protein